MTAALRASDAGKVVSARDAVRLIRDGDTVATGGFVGIGFAENIARDRGYKTVLMHARKSTAHFFEKQGYKIEGDDFIQLTIPHLVMKKLLV